MRKVLKLLLKTVFSLLFRVRISGTLPRRQPGQRLLIVANHESFLDGMLLGLFLPLDPVFVVNTGIAKRPLFSLVLGLVDHLAVDPTHPLAMRRVVKLLESGRPVVIFPEGRITTTGCLMKVYDGPAFAAARTGATILPVRIDGASRTYFSRVSGHYPKSLLPQLTLSIQPPVRIPAPLGLTAKSRRKEAGEHLRKIMQHMLFASHPRQTLPAAFLNAVSIYGRNRACLEDMKPSRLSYGDTLKMVLALSRLTSRITRPGETVGVLMPSAATTLGLLLGLQTGGCVPAMLNFTAGAEGMQSACHAACIHTLITSRAFIEKAKLELVVAALKGIELHYLEDLRAQMTLADKLWVALAVLLPRRVIRAGDPEQPAVVLFTSGTEGKPKGVVLSHRALLANVAQIRAVIDINPTDKVLNVLPLFHSFGLTGGALLPMLSGAETVLYPTPLHYKVIPELAYDRNCTVLYGTSTFLGQYARNAHGYDFHKLRYVIAGAEKLADSVRVAWVEKFGIRILEGYGATETAPVLAVNTPMAYQAGSVGQLLPGIEAQVIAVPGIERGGMLHVRGPNLMSGYMRFEAPGLLDPPASEAGDGWYNTGDVVEIDPAGFVSILGRVKRFAKIAGEMVSLEGVERLAVTASPEWAHAATSIADEKRGEAIILFSTDPGLTRERLQLAARERGLPEIAVPRAIRLLDALPVLGTGKTDYQTLKAMAAA
ncbi:MAG TPA: bifunctional acyl-ACP--phospholipid O-acyltransferase/long-chain-fatty-acid--ACP ligase [Thiobacillus sp.]|nr:MAG: bifunctional 2-acylglycerophosphoethanolamine acyltransferase/acyl-ACP synthetase [Hydrogenophilales bacterium 28-61-11]OYZ58520.1 MAG: bifunctional 2-acylglycerophosphoethanolamine acyltransferase/acyl-ACP synthetase [Hydrogenophilales bacterium 16-61-112]HQT29637.1 bifunctional acyl-ACP--phospholipid O-acyltransferase/long-chain-fatty-acid--ACP ligase [Thiobacillus sp.]HQT70227.1 bifunctional acyl-ACP--phospholipid O-acyltransferase/long-chain-fatty-acid--ACP ligase [Thiobacillus sp.]